MRNFQQTASFEVEGRGRYDFTLVLVSEIRTSLSAPQRRAVEVANGEISLELIKKIKSQMIAFHCQLRLNSTD